MSNEIKFDKMEVCIHGLTFVVSGKKTRTYPETLETPADGGELEFSSIEVKNQPDADADSILTAMKTNVRATVDTNKTGVSEGYFVPNASKITFYDGYDELEEAVYIELEGY